MSPQRRPTTRTVLLVLVLLGFGIWLTSSRLSSQGQSFDWIVHAVFDPPLRAFNNFRDKTKALVRHYFWLVDVSYENQILKTTLEKQTLEMGQLQTRLKELEGLKAVQQVSASWSQALLEAPVLSFDPFLTSHTVMVGVGAQDGVEMDSVCLVPEGLVGRVIQVFPKSSKVLLMTDTHFSVDVRNERSGLRAVVTGGPHADLKIKRHPYLSQVEFRKGRQEFEKGDVLVTSGLLGRYPKNLKVGEVLDDGKSVLPQVDFTKLSQFYIVPLSQVHRSY